MIDILEQPVFVGPHACERFRERIDPTVSDDEAKAAILLGLSGLDGKVSWRLRPAAGCIIASVKRGTYAFRAVLKKSDTTGSLGVATILPVKVKPYQPRRHEFDPEDESDDAEESPESLRA